MISICENTSCTGCMACVNVCAHNAINMIPDKEGFLRPCINQDLCKNCGLCSKVCPVNSFVAKQIPKRVYSGWSRDDHIRRASSSGGAFSEIALPILKRGGVVFGCMLNAELKAVHSFVESEEELHKLRGSKYVQSYIGDSYQQVRTFLREGREVLFSGTPCQIAALRKYLQKDYDNLWTVDIICHGVPSPLILEEYKKYIEESEHGTIESIKFRSKRVSWFYFEMLISFRDQHPDYHGSYYTDPYIRGFLRDYFLRPSCHQCQYATEDRVSDFTIADWWGYNKTAPRDRNYMQKGVSLILANSDKAVRAIKEINMDLQLRTIEEAHQTNICLERSFPPSRQRAEFWNYYRDCGFKSVMQRYMQPEKVGLRDHLSQKYPNTDFNLRWISLLDKITHIPQKINRIITKK